MRIFEEVLSSSTEKGSQSGSRAGERGVAGLAGSSLGRGCHVGDDNYRDRWPACWGGEARGARGVGEEKGLTFPGTDNTLAIPHMCLSHRLLLTDACS